MENRVVVLTGASSGIGRATALAFAQREARLVLTARRAAVLEEVAAECRTLGGEAIVAPADVRDEDAVRAVARAAIDTYGGIDVWVNNAAVLSVGRFEQTPTETFRRIIETNLFGYVHGARAALEHFVERGRGVLINNASGFAVAAPPSMSGYAASKFAILGLTESLRIESVGRPIDVCAILPATIDTPIWLHAANYTGMAIKPPPPIYAPETVARAIVDCAERPRAYVYVGSVGRALRAFRLFARPLYDLVMASQQKRGFVDVPTPDTDGSVFEPIDLGASPYGGWRERDAGAR